MSLASRRGSRSDSSPDDAKSSIVGLSGWLFADLMLALAVVFLVASEVPIDVPRPGGNPEVSDIAVEFLMSQNGAATRQTSQIDEPFDVWLRFSEPIKSETLDLSDISVKPEGQWMYQFVNKALADPGQVFLLRLAPLEARSAGIEVTLKDKAAQHASRESSFSKSASLSVSITICRSLTGIAVLPKETARFLIKNGRKMEVKEIKEWLESPIREKVGTDLLSKKDFDYGDARLVWKEIQKQPPSERRQVGFVILFGGYVRNQENADVGQDRASKRIEDIREVLRELSLLPQDDTGTLGSQCPRAAEVPVRPFGDGGVGKDDLKFELYFYNEK